MYRNKRIYDSLRFLNSRFEPPDEIYCDHTDGLDTLFKYQLVDHEDRGLDFVKTDYSAHQMFGKRPKLIGVQRLSSHRHFDSGNNTASQNLKQTKTNPTFRLDTDTEMGAEYQLANLELVAGFYAAVFKGGQLCPSI